MLEAQRVANKAKRSCRAVNGTQSHTYRSSLAIQDHVIKPCGRLPSPAATFRRGAERACHKDRLEWWVTNLPLMLHSHALVRNTGKIPPKILQGGPAIQASICACIHLPSCIQIDPVSEDIYTKMSYNEYNIGVNPISFPTANMKPWH